MSESDSQTILTPQHHEDCVLRKSIQFKNLVKTERGEVVSVRPCASEKGKIMAEIELPTRKDELFLDSQLLCRLLRAYKRRFTKMKCSSKLGVGRVMWKARRTYIYKHGKFDVRFALSQDDALKTMDSIGRLILGSIFCKKCGQPAIECALGQCEECVSNNLQSVTLDELSTPLFIKGFEALTEALEISRVTLIETSEIRPISPSQVSKFKSKIQEGVEFFLDSSLKTPEWTNVSASVSSVSLAFSIEDFHEKAVELTEALAKRPGGREEDIQSIRQFEKLALETFKILLEAFHNDDPDRLKLVKQKNSELSELLEELDSNLSGNILGRIREMYEDASSVWSGLLKSYSS
ncbi:hypothetical protein AKJ35_00695 [candidate division MSBL1 archaeon SCGC-AAA833F18]|uniref:Uncharacterized protein n=2 Tax=candidate division MSBL1 TaxID=215777 RepID=A0A133VSV7_9EURY|nr:hypothetical protein AKJ48_02295 [candidate division MSBL1 archaeon SCGC-AAA261O19]KXB09532.1 hypothetical protein AKJ35_00695 [candidate division MSBL1 archaeon SCGC-AAA833F18]